MYDQVIINVSDAGASPTSKEDVYAAVCQLEKQTRGDEYSREDLMHLFSNLLQSDGSGGSQSSSRTSGSLEGYTSNDTSEEGRGYMAAVESTSTSGNDGSFSHSYDHRANSDGSGTGGDMEASISVSEGGERGGNHGQDDIRAKIVKMNEEFADTLTGPAKTCLQIEHKDVKCCPLMYSLQCLQKVSVLGG